MLLSVAANQTAHEHHSANLIKHGKEQHEVMSADRAAVASVLLRRKTRRRFKSTVSYFLLGYFAEQISPQLSTVIKFQSQRKRGEFFVHMFGSLVRLVFGVGCIVEQGSEIVSSFDPIVAGKVVMTQVQAKTSSETLWFLEEFLLLFRVASADARHQFLIKILVYCVAEAFQ